MSRVGVRRGQIWSVDWTPGRGSEPSGRRPALVVQTDSVNCNPKYPNTIVVTVSKKGLPIATHVRIEPSSRNGLRQVSFAKCEQILTISEDRHEKCWGEVDAETLAEVGVAHRKALQL